MSIAAKLIGAGVEVCSYIVEFRAIPSHTTYTCRAGLTIYSLLTEFLTSHPQVFHATCRAEAVMSASSWAARLDHEVGARSRSGAPEYHRTVDTS